MRARLSRLNTQIEPGHLPNPSPNEETPLNTLDAWQTQMLSVPAPSLYEDDEFAYFESKLVRPLPFSFPRIQSACEKFSGIDHRMELDKALYPHKEALICQSPDEYKAILEIQATQRELTTNISYLEELRRSLAFLKSEQRARSSERAQKIIPGNK